jgi:site-specific recombinase XerC
LLLAVQTGLRLSEITGLRAADVRFGTGAHVHVLGKGRKERCTPLANQTQVVAVMDEQDLGPEPVTLFPSARGSRPALTASSTSWPSTLPQPAGLPILDASA